MLLTFWSKFFFSLKRHFSLYGFGEFFLSNKKQMELGFDQWLYRTYPGEYDPKLQAEYKQLEL